ncbi:uncharacterized protein TRIADDRAFT_16556, partial [Trichoplax adhaerens]
PRLYTSRFDPYSAGIRFVLGAKGIDYEYAYVDVHNKPEWYKEVNPTGHIPCLETGDEVVSETSVIYDYLEDRYPQVKTQPTDPYKKAQDKIFVAHTKEYLTPKITGCVKNPNDNLEEVTKVLKIIDGIMGKRGTDYLGGASPNFADYFLFGWVELLPALKGAHDLKFELDKNEYSNYWAWVMRMDKDKNVE